MRQTKEGIDGVRIGNVAAPNVNLGVAASPTGGIGAPAPYDPLQGFAQALSNLNPALERYARVQDAGDTEDGKLAGQADAAKKLLSNPNDADKIMAPPEEATPAFKKGFQTAYMDVIGRGMAATDAAAFQQESTSRMHEPNYNVNAHFAQFMEARYHGISDPQVIGHINTQMQGVLGNLRQQHIQVVQGEMTTRTAESVAEQLNVGVYSANTAEANAKQWQNIIAPVLATGAIPRKVLNEMFLSHLERISVEGGGRPDLFEALSIPDDAGKSPVSVDPVFAEKVAKVKKTAEMQADQTHLRNVHEDNQKILGGWESLLETNPFDPQLDTENLVNHIGRFGALSGDGALATMQKKVFTQREKFRGQAALYNAANNKTLGLYKESDQHATLDGLLSGHLAKFAEIATDPSKSAESRALMRTMVDVYANSGASVVYTPMKQWLSAQVMANPGSAKDGQVPPSFAAAADLYAVLEARAPHLAAQYAEGDVKEVLTRYAHARQNQANSGTAYQQSMASVTPEAKAKAAALRSNPEFQAGIAKAAESATKSFFDPRYWYGKIPFVDKYATNIDLVGTDARLHIQKYAETYPHLSESDYKAEAERFASNNYYFDPNLNQMVRVPPNQVDAHTTSALKDWTAELVAKGWGGTAVRADPATGDMVVISTNPQQVFRKPMQEIRDRYSQKTELNDAERATVTQWRTKGATAVELEANRDLFIKAKRLNAIPEKDAEKLDKLLMGRTDAQFNPEYAAGVKKVGVNSSPQYTNLDRTSNVAQKPILANKGDVSRRFAAQGNYNGALTAMAEGVALTAYPDPAKGTNIGIGYNMDANEGTLAEDFRKAGIPKEDIESIRKGEKSITIDQAMELYRAVQPRYEAIAKSGMDKLYPGQWDNLPSSHRAVLTDLAYQVGSVEKFPNGLKALLSGDITEAGEELKVKYKDRNTGLYKVDQGRHNLRVSMLNSPSSFGNLVKLNG
jgi:GH24 family phage-related lysozyme (muramidase)